MEEETSTEVFPEQAAKETDTNSDATFNEDSKELEDNIFELYRYLFVKKKMFNYSDLHFFEVTTLDSGIIVGVRLLIFEKF